MTVFDKIIAGSIPCQKVFEDDLVLAFHDIHPQAPVHVLVVPKKKIVSFKELADEETQFSGQYLQSIAKVAAKLGLQTKGYRVVFNVGDDGGQTVPYLHAHILGGKQLGGFE